MTINKHFTVKFIDGITIEQQTEGGLINIKPIVEWVNKKRALKEKEAKEVNKYFTSANGQEYVTHLLYDLEKLGKTKIYSNQHSNTEYKNNSKIKDLQDLGISIDEAYRFSMADLKAFEVYKDTRGKHAGTWFSPLLALDIVGWLDAEIRYEFNKIVIKELFKHRITISEKQRQLTNLIVSYLGKPTYNNFYAILNHEINTYVFGTSYVGIRNDNVSEEQFNTLVKLIDTLLMFIKNYIITDHYTLISKIKDISL